MPMTAPPRRSNNLAIATILVIAVIMIIAILAVFLILPSTSVTINNWHADGYIVAVIFTIDITNHGQDIASRTIQCTVTFNGGDSFSESQSISLDPGENRIITMTIPVTDYTHWGEVTGENWQSVTCKFV